MDYLRMMKIVYKWDLSSNNGICISFGRIMNIMRYILRHIGVSISMQGGIEPAPPRYHTAAWEIRELTRGL